MLPLLWLCLFAAPADASTDAPPGAYLTHAQAEALLIPALIGPPATTYDHTPEGVRPDTLAAGIESLALGDRSSELRPPRGLRSYARVEASARAVGLLRPTQRIFLTEHVGLAVTPDLLGSFWGPADAEILAESVRTLVKPMIGQDDLASIAVGIRDTDEGVFGVVVALRSAITAEPFPRVVPPGETVPFAGILDGDGALTALYVDGADGAVQAFEMPPNGIFHLGVTLPAEAGDYRATLARVEKNRFPDGRWFFSYYVEQDPPDRYVSPVPDVEVNEVDAVQREADIVQRINDAREAAGHAPLAHVVDGDAHLREILDGLPKREAAQVRYLRRALGQAPVPEQPHGGWTASFTPGFSADEAVWAALANPATRAGALDATSDRIAVGAVAHEDIAGWAETLAIVLAPVPDGRDVEQAVRDELEGRFRSPPADAPPELEILLTGWAEKVATGDASAKKALNKVVKSEELVDAYPGGSRVFLASAAPGQDADLSMVTVGRDATGCAIGSGVGDLGRGGASITVFIVAVGQ